MVNLFVGIGQGGCRLAKQFSDSFAIPGLYCNLTNTDFSKMNISRKDRFVIEAGGTGKDPILGESIVKKNIADLKKFLSSNIPETVMVVVGGGGGSGAGFLPHILKFYTSLKAVKNVQLLFILPEENEGVPTKPNAIHTLNRVINNFRDCISICLIDNEYLGSIYGHSGSSAYWESINKGIVRAFKKVFQLTNLENNKNYIDYASGFKALDLRDVQRVLFSPGGYVDIRELELNSNLLKALEQMDAFFNESSLLMEGLDSKTAGKYFLAIGIPSDYQKHKEHVMKYVKRLFDKMDDFIKTPDVVRCNYYNNKISQIKLIVGMSGITGNSRFKKLVNSVNKDMQKLEKRDGLSVIEI
jgi:cell division GTPase FtsZ